MTQMFIRFSSVRVISSPPHPLFVLNILCRVTEFHFLMSTPTQTVIAAAQPGQCRDSDAQEREPVFSGFQQCYFCAALFFMRKPFVPFFKSPAILNLCITVFQ